MNLSFFADWIQGRAKRRTRRCEMQGSTCPTAALHMALVILARLRKESVLFSQTLRYETEREL